ncbi:RNase H family protein [Aeromonas sobria]|uniref:RNase H family protein n=1 Tax=Aeromonas sobria TaxID=646 RepID=UPI003F36C6A3
MTEKANKLRDGLFAVPLTTTPPLITLFTDGCCFRAADDTLKAGFAVVEQVVGDFVTRLSGRLKGKRSAQRAEMTAVIKALHYTGEERVIVYSESAYVIGAVYMELPYGR